MRSPTTGHLLSFLFLAPFLVMLWVHYDFGYSDAFMAGSSQWDRESAQYNLWMMLMLYAGLGGFLVQAVQSYGRGRSRGWLVAKALVAAAYYVAIFVIANLASNSR